MLILTIETSCDETSIAIGEIKNQRVKLLSHVVSSQIELHSRWGGVVPTLAAREHQKNLPLVFKAACQKAGFKNTEAAQTKIDLIGVTQGPGLIPALWTGVNFAKQLSQDWQKPLIPVNHLEAHIYSAWTKSLPRQFSLIDNPFPLLALLVSGGHTLLIKMKKHLQYEILGETLDDAVGEAFDKVARILGLGYPGGAELSRLACKGKPDFSFSLPLRKNPALNFSFSGLKTAALYKALSFLPDSGSKSIFNQKPKPNLNLPLSQKQKRDLAKAFEDIAVESLLFQTKKALAKHSFKTVLLGGGVSANHLLRKRWSEELFLVNPRLKVSWPPFELTGDNAGMLVPVVYFKWQEANPKKKRAFFQNWDILEARANLSL